MVIVKLRNITLVTGLWSWLCFCISSAMMSFSRWRKYDRVPEVVSGTN
jgi:hypothetical protein